MALLSTSDTLLKPIKRRFTALADRLFIGRVFGSKRLFLGFLGEYKALKFLAHNGLKIISWRDRTGGAEIDIIALHGRTLVAVEVKTTRRAPRELRSRLKNKQLLRIKRSLKKYIDSHTYFPETTRIDMVVVILPTLFSRGEISWLQNLTLRESNQTTW